MATKLGRMARLAFAAGAVALLSAAAIPADARPFRMSVSGDANTMDPHSQNAGNVTLLLRQIYEPLVFRGKKLEIMPGLAASWQQLEPTRWRFNLRPNVKFSNGNAFNADDVVYSISERRVKVNGLGNLEADIAEISLEN